MIAMDRRAENAGRLREAADFVMTIPPEKFVMQHWWLDDGRYFDDWRNEWIPFKPFPCGCAFGWMIQEKKFGANLDHISRQHDEDDDTPYKKIGKLFGISLKDSKYIFDYYSYDIRHTDTIRPEHVATRMREVALKLENT